MLASLTRKRVTKPVKLSAFASFPLPVYPLSNLYPKLSSASNVNVWVTTLSCGSRRKGAVLTVGRMISVKASVVARNAFYAITVTPTFEIGTR